MDGLSVRVVLGVPSVLEAVTTEYMTVGLKQCIKLHNGEPCNLYSSINIIRAIKYKWRGWSIQHEQETWQMDVEA